MNKHKQFILLIILFTISCFFIFDINKYFTLEYLQAQLSYFSAYQQKNWGQCIIIYFLIYTAITALSIPGATGLTILAGAIFGLLWGVILVSFASTIGATIAFIFSRYIFRDLVQNKFSGVLTKINSGIVEEGPFYLFMLRLIPLFPFFIINIVMGLTAMRLAVFYIVSQLGMLAGTILYVNAGLQLSKINSTKDILSLEMIISFTLIGIFPLCIKRLVKHYNINKLYKTYNKPKKFDCNLIVIGAGAAGLVSAYVANTLRAKVIIIESEEMGGDCLNTGCVPSKALIRTCKSLAERKIANQLGFDKITIEYNIKKVFNRIKRIIQTIAPHDSIERYTNLGVKCIKGKAVIKSPYEVEINNKILTTKNIIISSGADPFIPAIPGLDRIKYLTSENIWDIDTLPDKLIVLGGGPIGCELAQCFARLGSNVKQIEMLPRLLFKEDPEVSKFISNRIESEGVEIFFNHKAVEIISSNGINKLICEHSGRNIEIEFDQILVALGRSARISGFGLEDLGISLTNQKTIKVNDYLQTNYPNIYACGDVIGPYQFTHTAAHQAWFATVNSLFAGLKKFKVDYSVIPWCTYTTPEVARVGLNELSAKEQNIQYEVTTYDIDDLDRAITEEAAYGFVKILTKPNSDKILGVTIVGEKAGDTIAEFVLAMKHGLGLNRILKTIHIYPTFAEANKYAAANWKKNHKPDRILTLLEKFYKWQLG